MNVASPLPDSPTIIEALGWTLIHSVWQLALLGTLYALLNAMLRRSSAQPRYLAGLLVLLAAIMYPAVRLAEADDVRSDAAAAARPAQAAAPAPQHAAAPRVDALGDPLPDGARLRLGTLRFRAPTSVVDLALSPDEKWIVTSGGSLIVWDAATGKEQWRSTSDAAVGAAYGVRSVAFSEDSRHFFTPDSRHTPDRRSELIKWDVATGNRESLEIDVQQPRPAGLPGHQRVPLRAVDVTRDGRRFALGGSFGLIITDHRGNMSFRVPNPVQAPLQIEGDRLSFFGHYGLGRFSPDERLVAVVTSELPQTVRLLDAQTGEEQRRLELADRLVRLEFSPDGRRIATTERDSAVRVYDVATGARTWSQVIPLDNPFENYTSAIAFSPDGKTVAAGATDHAIYLFEADSGAAAGRLTGHRWYPWALAFSADGRTLFSSGWDGNIRRWDLGTGRQLPLPDGGIHATGAVAYAPDGLSLVHGDDRGTIHLVRSADGRALRTFELPGTRYSRLAYSPHGRLLAGGGTSDEGVHVAVWEVATGELRHRWDWPLGNDPHASVQSLSFCPDGGKLAAAVFRQDLVYLFDVSGGGQAVKLDHRMVYSASFSSDGRTLATAGWDEIVRLWDVESASVRVQLDVGEQAIEERWGEDRRLYGVACSPDGRLVATAHIDGRIAVWRAGDMSLFELFPAGSRFVFDTIAFSPDGSWLATGSSSGEVELWDPLTAERMWSVRGHGSYVYSLAFGSDNATLVSGGSDGIGYLWELPQADPRDAADLDRLWNDLADGDGPAAYRTMNALLAAPERAIELLAGKVTTDDEPIDQDRVHQWLDQLDSDEPDTRVAAQKSLERAGSVALEPLREAVERSQAERRDYLATLLAKAEKDARVERRAVSLLAKIGTERARLLLAGWASRDPHGTMGRSAAELLEW